MRGKRRGKEGSEKGYGVSDEAPRSKREANGSPGNDHKGGVKSPEAGRRADVVGRTEDAFKADGRAKRIVQLRPLVNARQHVRVS